MKPYVRWRQVQEQLRKHAAETGMPYSFFDAMKDLIVLYPVGIVKKAETAAGYPAAAVHSIPLPGVSARGTLA